MYVTVGFENSTTESANNGTPELAMKWDKAEACLGLHVCNKSTSSTPRTYPSHRLAACHHTSPVHQEAKEPHYQSIKPSVVVVLKSLIGLDL